MDIFKNFVNWVCLYFVGFLFFLTAGVYALIIVVNPENIKGTLKDQGTYDKIVPAVLSSSTYSSAIAQTQQIPLNDPNVQAAAKKAFPAADLQKKTESAIDGTFNWLDGKTDKPQYSLDFTSNKQALADELSQSTESRLNNLPRCGANNIPESINAFTINCLPYGVNAESAAERASSAVANDPNFLPNPVVSADDVGQASQGTVTENPIQRLSGIRSIYEHRNFLKVFLPLLLIALSALGVWLATDRSKALKRLIRSYVSSGVGLLVLGIFIGFGFEKAVKAVSRDAVTKDVAGPVFISLAHQFRTVYISFAVIAFVVAIALYIVRRRYFLAPPTRFAKKF